MNQRIMVSRPRQRRRQFKDLRQSHSTSRYLGDSQCSKSLVKREQNRQFLNERQRTSRVSQYQNQQSRFLPSASLSQQKLHSPSSHSLVCVCCYNKKQAENKRKRQTRQKVKNQQQIKQMKESLIQQNNYEQQIYQSHLRQNISEMTDYNNKLIKRHQKQKSLKQNKKMEQDQQIRMEQQQLGIEKQNRLRYSIEQQERLRQNFKEQIRVRKQKEKIIKQSQQIIDRNCIVDSIIPKRQSSFYQVQKMQTQLKEQLIKQIQQKEIKKKRQLQERSGKSPAKQTNEFQLVTFAERRNQEARRLASRLKQNILNDITQKRRRQQDSKANKQNQRLQQQQKRKQLSHQQQNERAKQQQTRRKKIDNYLFDLKNQFQQNKRKRVQQLQWINERKLVQPIIKTRQVRQSDKQLCNGCDKRYPKKMLSGFVERQDQVEY